MQLASGRSSTGGSVGTVRMEMRRREARSKGDIRPADSVIEQLERLSRLRAEGALSREEFERLKKDLLS